MFGYSTTREIVYLKRRNIRLFSSPGCLPDVVVYSSRFSLQPKVVPSTCFSSRIHTDGPDSVPLTSVSRLLLINLPGFMVFHNVS